MEEVFPLSPLQRGIMFHCLSEPGSGVYVENHRFVLDGLEAGTFRRAWELVVDCYPALRTSVVGTGRKVPAQVVWSRVELPWREHDARGLSAAEQEAWVASYMHEDRARGFELDEPSLTRFMLVRCGEMRYQLIWTTHHIVLDGWSGPIVRLAAFETYQALRRGEVPDLVSPRPFSDFVAWLHEQDVAAAEAYWRRRLAGLSGSTRIYGAEAGRDITHYAVAGRRLSAHLSHSLRRAAARSRVTLNTLMQGAWALLLSRYSGGDNVVLGTVVSGRPEALDGVESMVGMFINTVPFRLEIPSSARVDEWLRSVQALQLEQRPHEWSPLWDVQRWSGLPASTPLFEVLYVFQNQPGGSDAGDDSMRVGSGASTFRTGYPLVLVVVPGREISVRLEYDADRYGRVMIVRMLRQMSRLLEALGRVPAAAGDPVPSLSRRSLMSAAERHQALVEDSDSARRLPAELRIHRRIARRLAATPDRVAVICGDQQLTGSALLGRAGELAQRLTLRLRASGATGRAGAGAGTLVGLCVERGPEMVAALLAVLESGAAYVPLDPGLPADRLAYMAADAGLSVLLSERRLAARVPAVAALVEALGEATLWLDGAEAPAAERDRALPAGDPSDLAYVIYTSGSTGKPKGVQLSHRNVVNFLQAMARRPGLSPRDTVLAVTTLSFDIAVLELLLPLAVGARTQIATSEVAADGERLARLIARSRASVMQATPATWQLLVQIGWPGAPGLKILCGGEALPPRLAAELTGRGRELWNLYGPTETTVWSAATRITALRQPAAAETGAEVTLGRPIDNTRLYLLDRRLRPVPWGIPGQLAIAGVGLARGYLHRPALTAGSFCPDPFAGRGERLYLTGDLVRRDDAGRLVYLGRLDHQVKLRGFRIELGEIEAALEGLPAVERAVVLLHGDGDGDHRLVAFLLGASGEEVSPESEIRDRLASGLPAYMIPASFVTVAELPLTPSGKVDRKALGRRASELQRPARAGAREAPRGTVEKAVAAAFVEVLDHQRVGMHDSFFALGGHSLLAARLIFRLRASLGLELPLRAVFEAPTVAGLAARLEAAGREGPGGAGGIRSTLAGAPPIEAVARDGVLPLSFGQERLWFLEQLEPGDPAYRLTRAVWIEGPLDVRALARSLREVIRRHQSLRTTFSATAGVARQVVSEEVGFELEVEHQPADSVAHRAGEIVDQEIARPFDLENGPLLKARLAVFGEELHLFVLCLHHIVTDGWSQGILVRELTALYQAFRRDPAVTSAHLRRTMVPFARLRRTMVPFARLRRTMVPFARLRRDLSPLPELTIQYPDFALWQRRWLTGEVLDRQLAFWRRQLAGVPALELPADFPRRSVPSHRAGVVRLRLAGDLVAGLATAGGGSGTTPFMVLMAGLAGLLSRLTGEDDFAVGSPVANRRRPELEGLIGLFINVVALRVDLTGEVSYRRLLQRVREVSLGAFDHQDLPFEKLVDELAPERHLGRSPLFQVLFALQNMEQSPFTLAGARTRVEPTAATTRFDLELYAWEVADGQAAGSWRLTFVYNADLFTDTRIRRMARWFVRLLEAAFDDPDAPLSRLPLLSAAERHLARVEDPDGADSVLATLAAGRPILPEAARRTPGKDDIAPFRPPVRPPRGPVEEAVAAAFCDVLRRQQVALDDSFFRLGGHSLLATQLLSRLMSALGVELPLRAVFEAPTVAGLAAHLEDARRAGQGIEVPPIVAEPRDRHLPLSHAQERLWFLDQMNPGDPTLNLPSAVRLRGILRPAALGAALGEVVRRHEALRTRFLEVDGRPVQEVVSELSLPLPVIDLEALPASRRLREVERWQDREISEPFDLVRGPLIRARLLRLAGDDHGLLLSLHHIAGDAWSLGLVRAELAALYNAAVTGRPSPLAEPPVQYGDYAVWQRRWLDGDALQQQTEYWRRRLDGPLPALELPADHLRPVVQTYHGRSVRRRLSPELCARLGELGWQQGATLFMVLLAAFKVLLSRWSGQHDVVVGVPIAGRTRAELEGLIGLFLNSLVLRTDLAGDPTFLEVLERVREATLGAFSHQEVPFEKLLMELQPERDPSRTPLFQVFFNMLELPPTSGQRFQGLEAEALAAGELRSKFDLTIYVSRRAGGIDFRLVYNADLFDRERMDELMAQYEAVLSQVAARPEDRVDRLSLVTERARRVLPPLGEKPVAPEAGWRGAAHDVFARLAAAEPGRPAVIDPQGTLSYGELAAQTDTLALELAGAGVSRGDLVAIYGHRSAALVWAVLGVLRAGGAFLILDPAHPSARQLEILKVAAPVAWIELAGHPPPESLGAAVTERFGNRRLALPPRSEWPGWRRRVPTPEIDLAAGDLAYVAFTSGSTGGPKGICGGHGSLSHFLPWQCEAFGFAPEDRFSMLSGLAHDPLQRDIFTPLQVGAAVVIPDPERMFQPGALASWMAEEGITVAHLTPALGQVLAETAGRAVELPALRWVFLVGDVLTRRLVAKLTDLSPASLRQDGAPALSCVNYYGATETQRAVAYHPVAAGESRRRRGLEVLPLGRGIPDVELLVLGRSGELAGIGEVGEIVVRSPHVALGYLSDPALTAVRFTPDPRGAAGRVYRTGDFGRYRPDGEAVFLRRADHQIKLRGYRIEPAEIEAVLGCHPAVREAAVGLMDDTAGEEVLVAWWTATRGAKARTGELRDLAAEHLPLAMVPALYVPLDDLPLTPTGKLDRPELRRLALPTLAAQRQEHELAAPRDAFQLQLVSLWEQVLRRNPIGVTDNFFDLGGHSLLAIRLFTLIEQTFDQELPISTLFRAPTVERLARILRREGYRARFSSVVPIHPWGDRPPLFCVHGITGDPFIYRHLSRHLGSDQPLYGLLARGLDGQESPFVRMEEMAAHYLREIRQVQPHGPYYLAGFCFGGVAASEIARQLIAAGERVALVASFDGHAAISRSLPRPVFRRYLRAQLRWRFEQHLEIARTFPLPRRIVYLGIQAVRLAAGITAEWRKRWLSHGASDRPAPPTDVAEANRMASRAYAPGFYPGKVTVFRSAGSLGEIFLDPELGWQVLARGGIELREIPGLHHAMFDEPNVAVLAAELRRCLDAASGAIVDTSSDQD